MLPPWYQIVRNLANVSIFSCCIVPGLSVPAWRPYASGYARVSANCRKAGCPAIKFGQRHSEQARRKPNPPERSAVDTFSTPSVEEMYRLESVIALARATYTPSLGIRPPSVQAQFRRETVEILEQRRPPALMQSPIVVGSSGP